MGQKAKAMFAAFMEVNEELREEASASGTLRTIDEIARDAFGQFRSRVFDRKHTDLAKLEARQASAVDDESDYDAAGGDSDVSSDEGSGIGVGLDNGA
jgi:hypothetical protein